MQKAKEVYYYAVRFGGASSYSTTAKSWCEESWVDNCV